MAEANISRNFTAIAAQITGSLPSWAQLSQLEKVIPMSFANISSPWETHVALVVTGLIVLICALIFLQEEDFPHPDYPLQNPRKFWDITAWKSKWDFIFGVRQILEKRIAEAPNEPFRILTDFGDMTILPPDYANEIRNRDDLSFDRVVEKNFQAHLSGLDVFKEENLHKTVLRHVIRTRLTQFLSKVTAPLSNETALTLQDVFTDQKEWHTIVLKDEIVRIVSRISARVFTGEVLCRNPEWQKITADYAMTCFLAADMVRMFPKPIRPLVHQILPLSIKVRSDVKKARAIVGPVLADRKRVKEEARRRGEPVPTFDDAIEWCEEIEQDVGFDMATFQLAMAVAAIHTTSDFLTQILLDLAEHPEYIEPLRAEIEAVLKEDGWEKLSLYKMRLLDSVCKETQRLRPIGLVAMHREVLQDIDLPGNVHLPKGTRIAISSHRMRDPAYYPSPDQYDGYRFLRMRDELGAGKDGDAHFVTTSPQHLGFGHGKHACPGRFFASNEVKVALCHILLKYDWRLASGVKPKIFQFGLTIGCDPIAKVEIRRRDYDLEALSGK
nr:FunM [Talaromyces coalescens]